MRILLWAPFGAGTHYWGPGTSAFRLYKNNKNKDIKVTLVHGSNSQNVFPDVFQEQIQIGYIDEKTMIAYIKYLIESYKWIKKNYQKYDVVHGITAYFHMFIPALFFIKYKKPVFLKLTGEHGGFGVNGAFSRLIGFARLRKKKANDITGYISISSRITENLLESGISFDKIHYIPNGVDIARFYPIAREEKDRLRGEYELKNIFTICYIGGLTKNKRVIETVKAVHQLSKNGNNIQLLIVGPDRSDGIVEKEINEYIHGNKIDDICIRIEHTSEPEYYYRLSDIFVLNSQSEGLSNSLLEAMASGLPCVAFPASGTEDLIENGINGYLTDGSSNQIADRIEKLYKDEVLYKNMSEYAHNKILSGYSTDFILSEHIRVFKNELNNA